MMGPKSAVFKTVDLPSGLSDLGAIITFLQDKNAITATYQKLTDLLKEVNTAIEKVGKAEVIDRAYDEIQLKHETADKLLSEAQQKAKDIFETAQVSANTLLEKANNSAQEIIHKIQERNDLINQKEKELSIREQNLQTQLREIQNRNRELIEKENDLTVREKERNRIESVLQQIKSG